MVYGNFKDFLEILKAADKVLHDKAFTINKIQNMMDINVDVLQWSINFLIRKRLVVKLNMKILLIKN